MERLLLAAQPTGIIAYGTLVKYKARRKQAEGHEGLRYILVQAVGHRPQATSRWPIALSCTKYEIRMEDFQQTILVLCYPQ